MGSNSMSIKPLAEGVRSSMRSGIILFDLSRVVEELVFNSLDANATKVSVYVGLGSCCVKVVDNGSGISRDGLVLLGERYVTSKLQHTIDIDAPKGCFGFRGEALASISDFSLLEIVTKAHGSPNGYRKIVKGSKCLYLGIDDSRKDVGTTVVVRDLFYNQPVRRKYLQSSPKKVLHSVKKCIFRIALVHSDVSFKVADIDSEDELLSTCASSTLSLLKSGFGIENFSSLHELNVSDGALKLSGYISGPCDAFEIKAFQYVYINSQFVSKGPIHKLLNHLAARFECLDPRKAYRMCQKVKRSRPQAYLSYIVNLSCPSSFYDLTFEPTETFVEFKDWFTILSFIEKAIPNLWRDSSTPGHITDIFVEDENRKEVDGIALAKEALLGNSEFAMKYETQNHQPSCHLASPPATKNSNSIFNGEHDDASLQEFYMDVSEFKEQQSDMESAVQSGYCFESLNGSPTKHFPRTMQNGDPNLLIADDSIVADDYFVEGRFTTRERSMDNLKGQILSSEWQKEAPNIVSGGRNTMRSLAYDEMNDGLEVCRSNGNSFLESCFSRANLPFDRALFASEEGFESSMYDLKTKRRRFFANEITEFPSSSSTSENFDTFSRTVRQDEVLCAPWFPSHVTEVDVPSDFDFLSQSPAKCFSSYGKPFVEEKDLASDSIVHAGAAFFQDTDWDVEDLPSENAFKWTSGSGKRATSGHVRESKENKSECTYGIMPKSSSQENCIASCRDTVLNLKDYAHFGKDISTCLEGRKLHDGLSVQQPDVSFVERKTDWTLLDSFSEEQKHNEKNESLGNQLRYQNTKQDHVREDRQRRSHSAPPFYKYKRRFISLHQHSAMKEGKPQAKYFQDGFTSLEVDDLKLHCQPNDTKDLLFSSRLVFRPYLKKPEIDITPDVSNAQIDGKFELKQGTRACKSPVEGFMPNEIEESSNAGTKWRGCCQQIANNPTSCNIDSQCDILDVSSGFLHLAGNLLVPERIHRNCLEDAKVLHQVDKKFIPIVAGGTLAVIDQHAADERIRLEELREKVLSGQAKTVTYLDSEEELTLPEIGDQLLHSYAEQIREWGWICNIQAQDSATFTKNLSFLHQQPTTISLTGVPCILGVNLSDGDLLEFLRQLADTDGSSSMPPAVLRVLNFKACRGAIMFGDSLLPSECALIVEELKQTSLCFQCAHGRPTTIPLVNLEGLHEQIGKLGMSADGSTELWHGLRRQELSLERAEKRVRIARS